MSKIISSFFTNAGSPAVGLSPTIRIWEVTTIGDTLVVNSDAMTEVGDGFYKYEFVTYDPTTQYLIRTDGGATLPTTERYQEGSNQNSANEVWNQQTTDFNDLGTFGEQSNDIDSNATAALAVLDVLLKYESNRTRVDPIANTLTIFDDDGTTILQVFDLKDENSDPSSTCIYERDPQ
jgi:hypothetical protein